MVTELRVAVSLGVITEVLFPKQPFGHTDPAQLLCKVVQFGLEMVETLVLVCRIPGMELRFEDRVIDGEQVLYAQRGQGQFCKVGLHRVPADPQEFGNIFYPLALLV
jgi:hypothetical protein